MNAYTRTGHASALLLEPQRQDMVAVHRPTGSAELAPVDGRPDDRGRGVCRRFAFRRQVCVSIRTDFHRHPPPSALNDRRELPSIRIVVPGPVAVRPSVADVPHDPPSVRCGHSHRSPLSCMRTRRETGGWDILSPYATVTSEQDAAKKEREYFEPAVHTISAADEDGPSGLSIVLAQAQPKRWPF